MYSDLLGRVMKVYNGHCLKEEYLTIIITTRILLLFAACVTCTR